jgi:carboxylesterase type B
MAGFYSSVLVACSPLSALNKLAPQDSAARTGRDIAFGPLSRQKLDVYAPRPSAKTIPVLVFFYGGSWNSGRRQDYAFAARALASRGFLVIVPDYRLYPEVRFPAFVQDGAAAIRWARDHAAEYGGDPTRIVLAGHSAGAYNEHQGLRRPFWAVLFPAAGRSGDHRGLQGLSGPAGHPAGEVRNRLEPTQFSRDRVE